MKLDSSECFKRLVNKIHGGLPSSENKSGPRRKNYEGLKFFKIWLKIAMNFSHQNFGMSIIGYQYLIQRSQRVLSDDISYRSNAQFLP
jgi:hypothetical protein